MDCPLVRKILHLTVQGQDRIDYLIFIQDAARFHDEAINIAFWQAMHLTQLPDDGAIAESTHGTHQGGMAGLIPVKDIVVHFIPFFPGEIYIKVWWRLAFGI
ncbi:hypothetical protein D3C86_998940 [compost metagenome]